MKTESIIRTLEGLFVNINLCTEEDFKRIDTLVINRTDFDGSILDVDFNDLLNFKYLYNLTISGCMIDNVLIDILSCLPNLKRISFIDCDVIEDISDSFSKLYLKDITVINTDFDLSLLKGSYELIKLDSINYKYFSGSCKKLDIIRCFVDDVQEVLKTNFEELYISNQLYLMNRLTFDDSNRKIHIMEENGQFEEKRVGFDG